MDKPTLYFIPGLGADRRIFRHYKLEGYKKVFLDFIEPLPKESFSDYAERFSLRIDNTEPFVLIGCSLGGMLAVEIAKYVTPQKIIQVSSLRSYKEFPWYLRVGKYLPAYKLLPFKVVKYYVVLARKMMISDKQRVMLDLQNMVADSSPRFFSWAIHEVLWWRGEHIDPNLYQIHGTKDKLLPLVFIKAPDYSIERGSHAMVVIRVKEIESKIKEILDR